MRFLDGAASSSTDETRQAIEVIVRRSRRDFSSVANEMLDEAVRMRRIPGIVFADGPSGRRARLAGTGLDVFEVVAAGNDPATLG